MNDLAVLGIRIDAVGVAEAAAALRGVEKGAGGAARATEDMARSSDGYAKKARTAATATGRLEAELKGLRAGSAAGYKQGLELARSRTEEEQRLGRLEDANSRASQRNMREKIGFYRELETMSGQYGVAVEEQNRLLDEHANKLRALEIPEEYVRQWRELKDLQLSRDGLDGAERAVRKYAAAAGDEAARMEDAFTGLFRGIDGAAAGMWDDLIENGKVSFSSLKGIFSGFLKDLMQMAVTNPITVSVAGVVSSTFGGAATSFASSVYGNAAGAGSSIPGSGAGNVGSVSPALGTAGTYMGYGAMGAMGYTWAADSLSLPQSDYSGLTAGGGAMAGAAVGSAFGPIGTAVGAVIGAIVGGIAGSFIGKSRDPYVKSEMAMYLTDSERYSMDTLDTWGSDIQLRDDVFEAHGGYAIGVDSIHGAGDEAAQAVADVLNETAKEILAYVDNVRDSLPERFQEAFDAELAARPVHHYYKLGDFDDDGIQRMAESYAEAAEEVLLEALRAMDFSEYDGKISRNFSNVEGMETFFAALTAVNEAIEATGELSDPTSEYVAQARAALDQMDAWADSMRRYGVNAEYAAELMEGYRKATIEAFVTSIGEMIDPVSDLEAGIRSQIDMVNGWRDALELLGATEEQLAQTDRARKVIRDDLANTATALVFSENQMVAALDSVNAAFDALAASMTIAGNGLDDLTRLETLRSQALADAAQALRESYYNDLRLRALAVAGGDTAGEQLRQSHVSQRVSAIATHGEDSREYANLLLVQQAEAMQHQADLARAEYERLAASLDGLAQTAKDAAASVESARLALVTELVNAERAALNGIREAVDAWVDAARSAFDSAAEAYGSALQTSIANFQAVADKMRSLQQSLWTTTSYAGQGSAYASSRSELDRLYSLAASGDKDAASSFASVARSFLDASKATAADYGAYQNDFYAVQAMIASLEDDANAGAASMRSELDLLQSQYDVQVKSNKTLAELRDEMESARGALDHALEEQLAAYERWGFEAVATGLEGLELAYREKVDEWIAADAALNDALLSGLTTQMELDSLRVSSRLDSLLQAYRNAEAAGAAAAAEYASAQYQSMTSLAQARQEAERLAQQALDLAAKAQAQIAATGGYLGSGYATEHELLQAKADSLNRGEHLPENAPGIAKWTVTNLKDFMLNTAGLSVAEWYERHGKLEGFAAGGLASGWALVGEQGPELVNFTDPGRVYTADQTRRMLTPDLSAESNGSGAAMLGALRDQNAILRSVLNRLTSVDKSAKDSADALDVLRENGTATDAATGATRKTKWAD